MGTHNSLSSSVIQLIHPDNKRSVLYLDEQGVLTPCENVVDADLLKLKSASELAEETIKEAIEARIKTSEADKNYAPKDTEKLYALLYSITKIKETIDSKHTHVNKDVLDKTNDSWTTVDRTKFDDIEEKAQVNKVEQIVNQKSYDEKTKAITLQPKSVSLENVKNVEQIPLSWVLDGGDNKYKKVANLDTNDHIPLEQIPDEIKSGLKYHGTVDVSEGKWPDEMDPPPDLFDDEDTKDYAIGSFFIVSKTNKEHTIHGKDVYVGNWLVKKKAGHEDEDRWDIVQLKGFVYSVNGRSGVITLTKADVGLDNVENLDFTNADNIKSGETHKIVTMPEWNQIAFLADLEKYVTIEGLNDRISKLKCVTDIIASVTENEASIAAIQQQLLDIHREIDAIHSISQIKVGTEIFDVNKTNGVFELKQGTGIDLKLNTTEGVVEISSNSRTKEYTQNITISNDGVITVNHKLDTVFLDVDLFDHKHNLIYPDIRVLDKNSVQLDCSNLTDRPSKENSWDVLISGTEYIPPSDDDDIVDLTGKTMKVIID